MVSQKKEELKLTTTENFENIIKLNYHHQVISEIESKNPHVSLEYVAILKHNLNKEVTNFLYEDW
jgi:hypothetical protein